MTLQPALFTAPDAPVSGEPKPRPYVLLPESLLRSSGNNPVAIGIFALIARLHFALKTPVPLSAADIEAYDPTLSRGAILRAISKLIERGFLVATRSRRKAAYTPAWGRVNGRVVLYDPDAPSLGKPKHLHAQRVDRDILDVGLGRLDPQRLGHAAIRRYTRIPLLGLRDVGAYAAGQGTSTLRAWQLVDSHGQPQPVDADRMLKLASQRLLAESCDSLLTDDGYARLHLPARPKSAQPEPERGELLIYVPPTYRIDWPANFASLPPLRSNEGGNDSGTDSPATRDADRELTPNLIENMIGSGGGDQNAENASQCGKTDNDGDTSIMSGTESGTCQGSERESGTPPPADPSGSQEEGDGVEPIISSHSGQADRNDLDARSVQLLSTYRVYPNLLRCFGGINCATLAASLHDLAADGSGIGAIISRWKAEPPQPDAADKQARTLAPADWPAEQVATLASFLRDGLPADDAVAATRDWTKPGARARQEARLLADDPARRRPGPPRRFHPDAPRSSATGRVNAAELDAAARWVEAHAPADFDAAMRKTMLTYYREGVRDVANVVASTRMWHAQLARQERKGTTHDET